MDWEEHVYMIEYTNNFEGTYWMSIEAFNTLLGVIREDITLLFTQSTCSTLGNALIYPELILAMDLRFLTGDSARTLGHMFGVSKPTARHLINLVLDVIDTNIRFDPIQVCLPVGDNAVRDLAEKWQAVLITHGLLDGHLGALDGWLPRTECPRGIPKQADYFSGHYQCFGLNV
eukprot:7952647-Ditylum_brightwellii.AAC.1